jgi:formiminoglutamase
MSLASSSAAGWFSLLQPAARPNDLVRRPDDPRLGEITEFWTGEEAAVRPGHAVLIGFPQDEGVRRNFGRPGAAAAPTAIRIWLQRLPAGDAGENVDLAACPLLDAGDVGIWGGLEESQEALAAVVHEVLARGAVPIILGGGHETAYGHYLGYVRGGRRVGVINLDAHLDVRPCLPAGGHSGSPFRQALEHPQQPLPGSHYVCLGAQPHGVSREHFRFAQERGCRIHWANDVRSGLAVQLEKECERLASDGCPVYVSLDADVVALADVPGVSAPNPAGVPGQEVLTALRRAGQLCSVASLDVVEINPQLDIDNHSARWAALAVWHFLIGLAQRRG